MYAGLCRKPVLFTMWRDMTMYCQIFDKLCRTVENSGKRLEGGCRETTDSRVTVIEYRNDQSMN